ncbi:MAG: sugar phosphate isomerase/epimerase [Gemmatimonadetes bacterium]|nr:MAG: sugar phosphate isomerase/epimerase [Gemmatimonadota bacterium]
MRWGYNTNGFANHTLNAALDIIADLGYAGVALTLDNYHCNPYAPDAATQIQQTKAQLQRRQLACVIETGARFLLNPKQKHEPTLISLVGREQRIDFLKAAIDLAVTLNAEAVSFWSGANHAQLPEDQAWDLLVEGCRRVAQYALARDVTLGFEPEPGMFIETLEQYSRLAAEVNTPNFRLTLDIGHIFCTETDAAPNLIRQYAGHIVNIHIEDIKDRVHQHLMFGEGTIPFEPVLQTLNEIGYAGLVNVELSRHSHMAPVAAERAIHFLNQFI